MVGSFGSIVFNVTESQILTISSLSGTHGSNWASHDMALGKPKSEYIGPKVSGFTFEIMLRAQDGVPPRTMLKKLIKMAEGKEVYRLIIGSEPVGANPFKLTDVSSEWGTIHNDGSLVECKTSLTVEEYL